MGSISGDGIRDCSVRLSPLRTELEVVPVIHDAEETKKILTHLVKVGRAPPAFDPAELN